MSRIQFAEFQSRVPNVALARVVIINIIKNVRQRSQLWRSVPVSLIAKTYSERANNRGYSCTRGQL